MSAGADPERPWWWWAEAARREGRAVVFDIDGVLSDASDRQRHLKGLRRDWDAFFAACGEDPLVPEAAALLSLLDPSLAVVLLSARPLRVREQTLDWLARYGLRFDLLVLRPGDDERAAADFKREEVRALRARSFRLELALEDDPRNLAMLGEEGVPALYIHSGYYG